MQENFSNVRQKRLTSMKDLKYTGSVLVESYLIYKLSSRKKPQPRNLLSRAYNFSVQSYKKKLLHYLVFEKNPEKEIPST